MEARKGVDRSLDPIVGLDDLGRFRVSEKVRLVVEHQCPAVDKAQHIEAPVEEHPVDLERERPLDPRATELGQPCRERRAAVPPNMLDDPLELELADRRVPLRDTLDEIGRHGGRIEVHALEDTVDGVAELRRMKADRAIRPAAPRGPA